MLDQRLGMAAVIVVTDGPAIGGRWAGHAKELVVLRGVSVGRGDDRPTPGGRCERHVRRRWRRIAAYGARLFSHLAHWRRGETEHGQESANEGKEKSD